MVLKRKPPFHADNEPELQDRSREALRYWLFDHIKRIFANRLPDYKGRLLAVRLSEDPLSQYSTGRFFVEVQLKRSLWRSPVWKPLGENIISSWVSGWAAWNKNTDIIAEEVPNAFAEALAEWYGAMNSGNPRVVSHVDVKGFEQAVPGALSLIGKGE